MKDHRTILIAGATGYVAGRLIPALLDSGYRLRALARSVEKLRCRPWAGHPQLEMVKGDVLDAGSLEAAATGCRAAYYLVHSMVAQKDKFVEADRAAARNMVAAAEAAGLERIIYLGGLAESRHGGLSRHLASRIEVAEILQSGRVPTTDLRTPMILGSGSASFEILRYLVEHLPVMTTPRWVRSLNQPIAIRNVIGYLVGCLERPETAGQTYDIGGPDVLSYHRLLEIYAEEAGLRRRVIIPVPVLTPTLSALWINLISPVPTAIALPLTQGLTSDAICREDRIRAIIPQRLLGCREAIHIALQRVAQEGPESGGLAGSGALPPEWPHPGDADYAGGTLFTRGFRLPVQGTAEALWGAVSRIGGRGGYYFADRLWRLRGLLDRMAGGRGLGHQGSLPTDLKPGVHFDFWRVLQADAPRRLVLLSEMKAPGDALLEFNIVDPGGGRMELRLISRFMPRGLAGLAYWGALCPVHDYVYKGMLPALARAAGTPALGRPARFAPPAKDSCRPLPWAGGVRGIDNPRGAPSFQEILESGFIENGPATPHKKENPMNVVDYCKGMEMELTAWKAKVYDLTRKVEKLGSKEREKILPNVQDLHMFIADMTSRIEQLKNECPTEWNPQKKDIDKGSIDMRGKYEQTMEYIGKASPVSIAG